MVRRELTGLDGVRSVMVKLGEHFASSEVENGAGPGKTFAEAFPGSGAGHAGRYSPRFPAQGVISAGRSVCCGP